MNAIPWYQSRVYIGAVVAIISQLVVLLGKQDLVPVESIGTNVEAAFQLIALLATGYAAWKRQRSPEQPLTLTRAGAENKNQGGYARPLMLASILLIAVPALVALPGCASSRGQQLTYRLVVNQAVQRYIWDAKTEEKRFTRAERIHEAAENLRTLASGEQVSLNLLRDAAYREIARRDDLIPPDVALLRELVDAVVDMLEEQVGEGLLNPEQTLRVTEMLDWIIGAAVYLPVVERST